MEKRVESKKKGAVRFINLQIFFERFGLFASGLKGNPLHGRRNQDADREGWGAVCGLKVVVRKLSCLSKAEDRRSFDAAQLGVPCEI